MVVEWTRESYLSEWHLFTDTPATTPGRYYFNDGAAHYPGFHWLGSRRWHDQNHPIEISLGEDLACRQTHLAGDFAGEVPQEVFVGAEAEIAAGTSVADKEDNDSLINGYPILCYIPPAPPVIPPAPPPVDLDDFNRASTTDRCEVQRLWARVIGLMYLDDLPTITDLLSRFFKKPVALHWSAATASLPAVLVVSNASFVCVAVDGTRNFQQLALQAFQAIVGPQDRGAFSTSEVWYSAGEHIHQQILAAGISDTRPVFLTGHSYGAVAALTLAARYRFNVAGRTIRYLTYGCPKIGDTRFRDLVAKCAGLSLANSFDLVTVAPPDKATLAPVAILFPLSPLNVWPLWERPPAVQTMLADGSLQAGPAAEMDFATLFRWATNAVGHVQQGPVVDHAISEYFRRLSLRCGGKAWPIVQEVLTIIDTPDEMEGGLVFAGGPDQWAGAGAVLFGGAADFTLPAGGIAFGGTGTPASSPGGIALDGG